MPLNNDDIKLLISVLQKALVDDSETPSEKEDESQQHAIKKTKIPKQQTVKTKNKKVANSSETHYNKFERMPERNMHKEDTKIDKVLSKYAPTERTRQFNLVNVRCRVCGKTEEINPNLIYDAGNRYKCNKCSKIPG